MTSAGGSGAGRMLERTLRTSPVTGIRVDPVLTAVLLAELLTPSSEIWLVSAWISDVPAVDNSRGDYDSLFGDAAARVYQLSEILGLLTERGTRLAVVTRDVPENDSFLARLVRAAVPERLRVIRSPDAHEKTFCGGGLAAERVDELHRQWNDSQRRGQSHTSWTPAAAQARIDFAHRWTTS